MLVDTHVHVFTDDRKNYPRLRDTPRPGAIPSIAEIGQTEWPLTTTENLIAMMDEAGVAKATLVQAYFVYEYDNSYTVDSALKYPARFASVVVLDPMDENAPDTLSRLVEKQGVTGIRFMRGRLPESSLGNPATFPLWERIQSLKLPLAANPNVYIKTAINNIAAAREGGGTPEQLYTRLVEVFGAKRIMGSSNYPAHPKFRGIKPRLEESKKALAHLSADDQAWILGKTAVHFYPSL